MKQHNYDNSASLKEVILEIFNKNNLTYGIDKVRVKEAWIKVAGTAMVKYTENVRLQGDRLLITLNNAALRENLSYQKSELAAMINEYLQKEVVKEIVFN